MRWGAEVLSQPRLGEILLEKHKQKDESSCGCGESEPMYTVGRNVNCTMIMGNITEAIKNTKNSCHIV